MSMLAERRRKTRYVINPTRKPLWTTDSSGIKFGKELMEKMGWSAGKGLGAKEQGIQEPLRVSYKNDSKGMGFKGNDENWIEHQDEFNSLLNQLASQTEAKNVTTNEENQNGVMSLEEKSKLSKTRVHYQKFTRGKDLSKYSENDLLCILGTGKKKKVEETVEKETPPENNTFETSFGVTTINSGSLKDYFKKKWTLNNAKSENSNVEKNESGFNEGTQISDDVVDENKSKKRARDSEEELQDVETRKHKKKRRKRDEEESKEGSKVESCEGDLKSGKSEELQNGEVKNEVPNDCSEDVQFKKRKKKKKDSKTLEEAEPSSLDLNNQTEVEGKVKHKKKKKEKKPDEIISESIEEQNNSQENSSKKKRKKDKKEEAENRCEMVNGDLSLEETKKKKKKEKKPQDDENNCEKKIEDNGNEQTVKKKKKKKSKEMDSPPENNNCPVEPDTNLENVKKEKKKKKLKENIEYQVNGDSGALELTDQTVEESSSKRKKKKTEEENEMREMNIELPGDEVVEDILPKKKKKKMKDEEIAQAVDQPEEIKKKNKKTKKEKVKEETKSEDDEQTALESHEESSKKKKHKNQVESSDVDVSENKINLKETEVGAGVENNERGETLIHSHKTELFKMRKPFLDKVKKYSTAKALDLFCNAEVNKFRGSNLENIPGYGVRKEIKNTLGR